MAAAIGALRERIGHERAIFVFHTDLPGNDFTALFQTLATDPASYLRNDSATFAAAVGRSYFEQILPAGSVTLGWSAWAVQWLSRVPCAIPDQVQIAYSHDAAARSAFAQQAADDWRTFLAMRSRELRSGIEPFAKTGIFADLSISEFELFHAEDRIWTQFEASGDAHAFGVQWAAFARASVFPTLAASLDEAPDDTRSARFIDELEAGVTARLSAAPTQMTIPLAQMTLVKANASAS